MCNALCAMCYVQCVICNALCVTRFTFYILQFTFRKTGKLYVSACLYQGQKNFDVYSVVYRTAFAKQAGLNSIGIVQCTVVYFVEFKSPNLSGLENCQRETERQTDRRRNESTCRCAAARCAAHTKIPQIAGICVRRILYFVFALHTQKGLELNLIHSNPLYVICYV